MDDFPPTTFFIAPNLAAETMEEGKPWEFVDPEGLAKLRILKKPVRRERMNKSDTRWQVYSAFRGLNPRLIVADDNPAQAMRGLVVDYDAHMTHEEVSRHLDGNLSDDMCPTFLEITLGRKVRLVWVFAKEVLFASPQHAAAVLDGFADKLKIRTLLAGYDAASIKTSQRWTNGGEWMNLTGKAFPDHYIKGIVASAAQKSSLFGHEEVPIATIAERVQTAFPGRWKGDFKLDALGVRFWDSAADCETGCQVKPDGMLCFTGRQGFVTWAEIFGKAWCDEQRVLHLGRAAEGVHYDSRNYWRILGGVWQPASRGDITLDLTTRGISDKIPRGETASDVSKVLSTIQHQNTIAGAAPLINYPMGIVILDGRKILNTLKLELLQPASPGAGTGDIIKDAPFIWDLTTNIWAHPELRPRDYFFAWWQRFLFSLHNFDPMMGQAIFLCGPKHNGKTLLCTKILSATLGNRMANPYDHLVGDTPFNDDLFQATLLAINDEESPRDASTKSRFLSRLKSFVVNTQHTYHPKFCARVPIVWNGRIFVTLNDDPESLGMLPEVNSNTEDKMMFFGTKTFRDAWPENKVIEATIREELPYVVRYLLSEYKPPADILIPSRCGIKSYYDPIVLQNSRLTARTQSFREILILWVRTHATWEDPARELWRGIPTELHGELEAADNLKSAMRGFGNPDRVAQVLFALSRIPGSGVTHVADTERSFQISREKFETYAEAAE